MQTRTTSKLSIWLMAYVGLLFLTALFFLIITMFPDFFGGYTLYPLILNLYALKGQLACLIIPISIGIIVVLMLTLNIKKQIQPFIVATMLGATIMACCASFIGLAVKDKEQVKIRFENNIYDVISSESDFGPNNKRWVTLYECDQNNFLCRLIFHGYALSTNATLVPDSLAHTVTLQIDGEAVYVHPVK